MVRRAILATLLVAASCVATSTVDPSSAKAAGRGQPTDWARFYHYPYVYYPHNYQQNRRGYDHMYYKYPQSMQIPVYNKGWHNFYPTERPYHEGHHFRLDVF